MSSHHRPPASVTPPPREVALAALKGDREFRRVRRLGSVIRSPLFTLRVTDYRPRHGQPWRPAATVGIVVPKKVLKHAVDRNRARRRVREALRTLPRSGHGQALVPCRAILFPTPGVLTVPFAELQAALARAMADVPAHTKKAGKGKPNSGSRGEARRGSPPQAGAQAAGHTDPAGASSTSPTKESAAPSTRGP